MMLGGSLSALGQIMIQAGPAWNKIASHPGKIAKAQIAAFNQLGKLKSKPRQKLFKALLPRIFLQVESTWNLFDILPYQTIYYRRPFRNPNHYSPFARIVWLQRLIFATHGYDQDVIWFAAWAAYLGYTAPDALGYLFAGAIEAGGSSGQEVFEVLVASANGSHEIGVMGRHVVRGLLCAGRPDGWEFVERLLLAAQREEGLRQVILECVDEAHPQAFRRLLNVILEHNLCRFSAAMRAFNVWFGLAFESAPPKTINHFLASILCYLGNPIEREKALREGTAQEAYYALWSIAFEDALAALPHAIELRQSHDVDRRFAATHFLAQMDLVGSFNELLNALEDPDLRIAARAVSDLTAPEYTREVMEQSDLFERLERLIARLPHKENTFKPLVWEWFSLKLQRTKLAGGLIESLGSRSPKRLIPYLSMMEPVDRSRVA
jgi:hypothetical protein